MSKTVEPIWPDDKLEAEMMASASTGWDAGCHIRALLDRVRDLERALKATGYFQQVLFDTQDDKPDYFTRWKEAVEYTEGIDAMLDGEVPTSFLGNTLWLRSRVELLLQKAKDRSSLAMRLWKRFHAELWVGIKNGYWPDLKPLFDDCLKELGVPKP